MDENRNFHAVVALAIATNEVVSLRLVKRNEIFATAPVAYGPFRGAIVIPSLVHLKYIVLRLLVPECWVLKQAIITILVTSRLSFFFLPNLGNIR